MHEAIMASLSWNADGVGEIKFMAMTVLGQGRGGGCATLNA
jgi:hypothetical protein